MRLALLLCVMLTTAANADQSLDAFRDHLAHPTIPKTPEHPSADYQRGFCAGYNLAAWASRQNVDNFRARLKPVLDSENPGSGLVQAVLDGVADNVPVPQLEPINFSNTEKTTYVDVQLNFDKQHPTAIRCDGRAK